MDELPVEPEHVAELSRAQSCRALRDHLEHGLDVGRRATDDVEHFACRGLVFERFLQLSLARLLCLEQPRVLDGDDGLVGEGLQQVNLTLSKRMHLQSAQHDCSDGLSSPQKGYGEYGAMTQFGSVGGTLRELIGFRLEVSNVHG